MGRGIVELLRGRLTGMDRERECDVLARRVEPAPEGACARTVEYRECLVLTAPNDLPDGDYMAYFSGHSFPVHRKNGLWISIGESLPDSAAEGLPRGRAVVSVQRPSASDTEAAQEPKPEKRPKPRSDSQFTA